MNTGDGTFTDVTSIAFPVGIPGLSGSSVAWGDYNNDGGPDLLITGQDDSGTVTQLWQNNGDGTFTNVTGKAFPTGFRGVQFASVAWCDYDRDGRLDLLITGNSSFNTTTPVTQLWRNDGDGTFTDVAPGALPGIPGVCFSSVAWGDSNNDGRPDLLVTGISDSLVKVTQLWQNNGNGTFTNVTSTAFPTGIPAVGNSSVAWGDYDHDGRLDLVLSGFDSSGNNVTQLWHHNGNGTFTDATSKAFPTGIPEVAYSSLTWGDDNHDGQLDFLLTGSDMDNHAVTQLWQNQSSSADQPPAAPGQLQAIVRGATAFLSWAQPTGPESTPAQALTYQLRVGTTPGGDDVLAPLALAGGTLTVPQNANLIHGLSYRLQGLGFGKYYWSVQAVDNALQGSPFAAEGTFSLDGFTNVTATALPAAAGLSNAVLAWGDYNGDGRPDLLVSGPDSFTGQPDVQLWQQNTDGTFSDVSAAAFPQGAPAVQASALAWGDYNNDGRLDFILTGISGGTPVTELWRHSADGAFTNVTSSGFTPSVPGLWKSEVAWVDFNHDGRLDFLVSGDTSASSTSPVTELWENLGGTFVQPPRAPERGGGVGRL